ncbi:MAG: MerR family transcriptional regulator [Lachnospiraceae bacterium]|nr:MerR family transcriptional regulator [Lachnospiraceae bacterium]MDO4966933.1 MerR family transcriptional regulator [Lachnospiraceae bacterium]
MKIKQVEELVGITQKNIRFYEDQGLIRVERAENGYREYNLNDVKRLREIKLLRLIAVPIEDIKLLFSNKKSLDDILKAQVSYLENQRDNMEKMRNFCEVLADKDLTLESLDVEECLNNIEQLEREGAQFMEIKSIDVHLQKKLGALLGFSVMATFALIWLSAMIYAYVTEEMPLIVLFIAIAVPVIILTGLIIALIQRNKEIEGGEEDEASKY